MKPTTKVAQKKPRVHVVTSTSGDPPDWLRLIWESNIISPGIFGRPSSLIGGVEDYPDATVIHLADQVSVASKTARGDRVIAKAAKNLSLRVMRK